MSAPRVRLCVHVCLRGIWYVPQAPRPWSVCIRKAKSAIMMTALSFSFPISVSLNLKSLPPSLSLSLAQSSLSPSLLWPAWLSLITERHFQKQDAPVLPWEEQVCVWRICSSSRSRSLDTIKEGHCASVFTASVLLFYSSINMGFFFSKFS